MVWPIAAAIVGSSVIGGIASGKAAREQTKATDRATAAQERAAEKAIASQERMFERQIGLQEPFRQVGVNALPELVEASKYKPFTYEDFVVDPGYRFRLQEGLKALDRSAAARGGLLGGNQLRGVTQFGQNLASEEYGNAFNRYNIGFQNRLNPLQSLAGFGQTSTATMAGQAGDLGSRLAQTYSGLGQAMAGNIIGAGNARASGYMGMANALTGGLGQYLNYQQNQDFMKLYGPRRQPNYANSNQFQSDISDFEGIPGMGGD